VYYDPSNLFVARFIGSPGMNLLAGRVEGTQLRLPGASEGVPVPAAYRSTVAALPGSTGDVIIGFRPESAYVSAEGALAGEVYASDMHGAYRLLHVNVANGEPAGTIVHVRSDRMVDYPMGSRVRFDIQPEMMRIFDPATEKALARSA
jgi:multiple sugar transport system ATP-binding protein